MDLEIYPTQVVERIERNVAEQSPIDSPYLDRAFDFPEESLSEGESLLPTPFEVSDTTPDLIQESDDPPKTDGRSAELIYRYLKDLDRTSATDRRLWITLTHREFSEYSVWRWMERKNYGAGDRDSMQRAISHHFFIHRSGKAGLRRNAVARLWWGAELTHKLDERVEDCPRGLERQDPFFYTKVLFSAQQIGQSIIERNLGSDPKIRLVLLDCIDHYSDEFPIGDFTKALTKSANMNLSFRDWGAAPTEALWRKARDLSERVADRM